MRDPRALLTVLLLLVTSAAEAATYRNTAQAYTVELPDGWQTKSDAVANPAILSNRARLISVKLQVTPRKSAMNEAAVAALKAEDEQLVARKSPRYKPVALKGPKLLAQPTMHYAFVYKDSKGTVNVARFVAASAPRDGEHVWVKLQAVFPKGASKIADEQVASLISSFVLQSRQTAVVEPTPVPTPVSTAPPPLDYVKPPEQPKVDSSQASINAAYWAKRKQKMSATEARMFNKSFEGSGDTRTAEEEERARQLGLGGIFKPTDK
jgi:hypothetical protein